MSDLGHNSGVDLDLTLDPLPPRDTAAPADANPTDDRLRLLVERIERLEEEKKGRCNTKHTQTKAMKNARKAGA